MYKNVKRFPTARQIKGVAIVRMEDRLFFANISFFRRKVARLVRHAKKASTPFGAIVVDASSMNGIDATSMQVVMMMHEQYENLSTEFNLGRSESMEMDEEDGRAGAGAGKKAHGLILVFASANDSVCICIYDSVCICI